MIWVYNYEISGQINYMFSCFILSFKYEII